MPEPINISTSSFVEEPPAFCFVEGLSSKAGWADGHEITVAFQNIVPHPAIRRIVEEALSMWNSVFSGNSYAPPTLRMARPGEHADVRIALPPGGNDDVVKVCANSCVIGANCLKKSGSESTATLSLSYGGGVVRSEQAIFSQQGLLRNALHLFGHVLGLPHAQTPPSYPGLNASAVSTLIKSRFPTVALADVDAFVSDRGDAKLDSAECLMHCHLPASLTATGKAWRYGGQGIDAASKAFLEALYRPAPPDVSDLSSSRLADGQVRSKDGIIKCAEPSYLLAGLKALDWNAKANLRIDGSFEGGDVEFRIQIRTWEDTTIDNAKMSYLVMPKRLVRKVQVGGHTFPAWQEGAQTASFSFNTEFSNPKVVVAISSIDSSVSWVRCNVYAKDVTRTGCTLVAETWADTRIHQLKVTVLVHEADNPVIRSGRFIGQGHQMLENPGHQESLSGRLNFSSPLSRVPRAQWCGFCHINSPPRTRIRSVIRNVDAQSADWELSTWEATSSWHGLDAVYVFVA